MRGLVLAALALMLGPFAPRAHAQPDPAAPVITVENRGGSDLCVIRPSDEDRNILEDRIPAHSQSTIHTRPVELEAYGCDVPSERLWHGRAPADERSLEIDYWRLSGAHPFFLSASARVAFGMMESSVRPSLLNPGEEEASWGLVLEYGVDVHIGIAIAPVMIALVARAGASTWVGETYGDWNGDGFTDTLGGSFYDLRGTTRLGFAATVALGVLGYGEGSPWGHDSGPAIGAHFIDGRVLATLLFTYNLVRTSDSSTFGLDVQYSTDFQGPTVAIDLITVGLRGGWFL